MKEFKSHNKALHRLVIPLHSKENGADLSLGRTKEKLDQSDLDMSSNCFGKFFKC